THGGTGRLFVVLPASGAGDTVSVVLNLYRNFAGILASCGPTEKELLHSHCSPISETTRRRSRLNTSSVPASDFGNVWRTKSLILICSLFSSCLIVSSRDWASSSRWPSVNSLS